MRVSQEPVDAKVNAAAWERSVASLPVAEREKAISARLKELNPGYSGQIKWPGHPEIDMYINGPELWDISPIRAMPSARILHIRGANVTDLSPLRGMQSIHLDLTGTSVSDLTPLQDMKSLRELDLTGSKKITDLSPLKGMALKGLSIAFTQINDLTPLRDMKLIYLNCDSSRVSDLSPLKGMPLKTLRLAGLAVTDLSPLESLPLETIICNFEASRNAKFLRTIKTLKTINGKAAADFWKEADGE